MHDPTAPVKLPKGDCRFILPDPSFPGQRCACVGFRKDDRFPGSACECGHQACFHERHPSQERITRHEYDRLLSRLQWLENAHHKSDGRGGVEERLASLETKVDEVETSRDLDAQANARAVDGAYHSLNKLERETREIVKNVSNISAEQEKQVDSMENLQNEQSKLQDDFTGLDLSYHRVQDKVDSLEKDFKESTAPSKKRRASHGFSLPDSKRCSGDDPAGIGHSSSAGSPAYRQNFFAHRFRAIFLPPNEIYGQAPSAGSDTERRLDSRGLIRDVEVSGTTAKAFRTAIEGDFSHVLINKHRWMPLAANQLLPRGHDMPTRLHRLTEDQRLPEKWDMQFLDVHCVVDEEGYGNTMYLTLRGEDLGWNEIKALPVVGSPQLDAWSRNPVRNNSIIQENPNLNDFGTTLVPSEPSTRSSSVSKSSPLHIPGNKSSTGTIKPQRSHPPEPMELDRL